jgi:hypothetical protein
MADSDNSTTLPANIKEAAMRTTVAERAAIEVAVEVGASDPVLKLWLDWREANLAATVFCRLQQKRETRLLRQRFGSATHHDLAQRDYRSAQLAEIAAMDAEERVLAAVSLTPATSLSGVLAKLEIIVSAGKGRGGMREFPWPLIQSTIHDLKNLCAEGVEPGSSAMARAEQS